MKKSLFIAAALLYSGLGVQAATLKYYDDFNKLNGSLSSLNDSNLAGETAGTAAFSGGWINYTDGYEGKGYDSRSNGGQPRFNASGITQLSSGVLNNDEGRQVRLSRPGPFNSRIGHAGTGCPGFPPPSLNTGPLGAIDFFTGKQACLVFPFFFIYRISIIYFS